MELNAKTPIMLIIPDVHGRMFWRTAIRLYPDLPTIFLGDYLDPYTYLDGTLPSEALCEFRDILQYKKENHDRVTLLLGNHDVHYFDPKYNCSRKDWMSLEVIADLFFKNLSLFKLTEFIEVNGKKLLYSHAGIIPRWMKLHFPKVRLSDPERLSNLLNEQLHDPNKFKEFVINALMDCSASRGGKAKYPSILWADVEDHRTLRHRLPNVYQIFGHTQQESGPVITDYYANLDCRKAFLLMDDGEIEQIPM